MKRGVITVDLRGSLFCEVRETSMEPLCGFYAAAIGGVLRLFDVTADARVNECRAAGASRGCVLSVTVAGRASDRAVAA
jgi:predicted hydrocarbon binding protein